MKDNSTNYEEYLLLKINMQENYRYKSDKLEKDWLKLNTYLPRKDKIGEKEKPN